MRCCSSSIHRWRSRWAWWRAGGFSRRSALFATERPLDADEQRLVLRAPLRMMRVHVVLWGMASIGWPAINAIYSPLLALKLSLTVLLAGLTTCTIVYLLTERIFRAAVSNVLSTAVPPRPGTPSVAGRSILAWALGSGIPVLGVVLTAAVAEATGHMAARRLTWVMLVLGGITLAVGLLVTLLAAGEVADPISSLHQAITRVERGDLRAEVIFGAPLDLPDACTRALAAACELFQRLEAEAPEVKAAIGVSAGQAVAGNIGAENRFEYTVIGDPVNDAARLTELAKATPGRVLASGTVREGAGPAEAARWRFNGEATVRGRTEPTRLAVPRVVTDGADGGPLPRR